MQLASGDTIAATHAGVKGSKGLAGQAVRTFEKLGGFMRANKRSMMLLAGAGALAGLVMAGSPKDLTPEAVEGGQVAGGPAPSPQRLPMPRMEKGQWYNPGSKPGYKVNLNLSKEINHSALARQLSRITGDGHVNVNIHDSRRRITRHEVEREMQDNRMLNTLRPSGSFYNASRYQ
jgi:hypothetical protein